MTQLPAALPHGPIAEIFADIFQVTGRFKFAPGLTITRNMTILRVGTELTLVNSVRLTDAGLAELDKLGKVTKLLKIGAFHGVDDAFYVDRYRPEFWAPPKSRHANGLQHSRELVPGAMPVPNCHVFAFEAGKRPEVALRLDRDGGVLVTCDSYQHWTTFDGCSPLGKIMMRMMGFGPKHIGGPWVKEMGDGVRADFDRLLQEPFRHLLPAHGTVLRDDAVAGLREAMAKRFG